MYRQLRVALAGSRAEEKVRGFLALALVLVLIALVIESPGGTDKEAAIASTKTLVIAVVAFYFGLHKGTPQNTNGGAAAAGKPKGADPNAGA